ncbi:MAG: hypothetical protein LBS84_02570 [Clostridiales bacterium]|jgi:hypothetical protein|nr:hypothetical protein [Clostridiales bacterium]
MLFPSTKADTPYTKGGSAITTTELTTTVRTLKAELDAEIEAAQDIIKAEMTARDKDFESNDDICMAVGEIEKVSGNIHYIYGLFDGALLAFLISEECDL